MLFRLTYIREGLARGITFAAADIAEAAELAETWERVVGSPALTLKPVGWSKFPQEPYSRRRALPVANSALRDSSSVHQLLVAEAGPEAPTSADFGF